MTAEFDCPADAWFFEGSSNDGFMPYSILMEIALQTCGVLTTWNKAPLARAQPRQHPLPQPRRDGADPQRRPPRQDDPQRVDGDGLRDARRDGRAEVPDGAHDRRRRAVLHRRLVLRLVYPGGLREPGRPRRRQEDAGVAPAQARRAAPVKPSKRRGAGGGGDLLDGRGEDLRHAGGPPAAVGGGVQPADGRAPRRRQEDAGVDRRRAAPVRVRGRRRRCSTCRRTRRSSPGAGGRSSGARRSAATSTR